VRNFIIPKKRPTIMTNKDDNGKVDPKDDWKIGLILLFATWVVLAPFLLIPYIM
jgi:hypothetical protein